MKIFTFFIISVFCGDLFAGKEWVPPKQVKTVYIEKLPFSGIDSNTAIGMEIKATSLNQTSCLIHVLLKNKSKSSIVFLTGKEFSIESTGKSRLKKRKSSPDETSTWFTHWCHPPVYVEPGETVELEFDLVQYFELAPGLHAFDLEIQGYVGALFSKKQAQIRVNGLTMKVSPQD